MHTVNRHKLELATKIDDRLKENMELMQKLLSVTEFHGDFGVLDEFRAIKDRLVKGQ
jgi:hypothetical protein